MMILNYSRLVPVLTIPRAAGVCCGGSADSVMVMLLQQELHEQDAESSPKQSTSGAAGDTGSDGAAKGLYSFSLFVSTVNTVQLSTRQSTKLT